MKKILSIVIILFLILFVPFIKVSGNSNNTKTPIKHVINIFLENHAFDNFFGVYPSDPYSWNTSLIKNLSVPVNLLQNKSLLNMLNPMPSHQFSTPSPIEGYLAYHYDWDNGKMDNFKKGSGLQSMTYYTASQLGLLWDLAEEYSIGDMFFASQMSESAPNTLYYYSGYSPVFNDYGPPPYIPFSETIFGELDTYHISWGIYVSNASSKSFTGSEYISGLDNYISHIQSWKNFISGLDNGTLPAVSWVFSQGAGGYDMGPPSNILKGELWIIYLINKIENSVLWNSTAVFITWDDPGGYYDQVNPPVLDGVQLGMRVPFIVVSPFAKEDYISSTVMNFASILAFIDYNWNVPALNKFVSHSNLPIDMFNFDKTYIDGNIARPPMNLNNLPLASNVKFNLPENSASYDFSSIFPMIPQYPLNDLPYDRYGNSATTLSKLNSEVFVDNNIPDIPFFYTRIFFIIIVIIEATLLVMIFRIRGGFFEGKK